MWLNKVSEFGTLGRRAFFLSVESNSFERGIWSFAKSVGFHTTATCRKTAHKYNLGATDPPILQESWRKLWQQNGTGNICGQGQHRFGYPHSRQFSASVLGKTREAVQSATGKITKVPTKLNDFFQAARAPGHFNRALSLQFEAFWQNYNKAVLAVTALCGGYLIWKATGTVSSSSMRMYIALVLLGGGYFYLHRRFSIDPEAVYRLALLKLNTHAGILDVMGAPLAGSNLKAFVLSGGGVRVKGMKLTHRSRRVQMVFPLRGADRRGLVFLEAKKRQGQYQLKVLGVDVPSHGDQEERLYVVGDPSTYNRGGVLNALRDPLIKAHVLKEVFEQEDDQDDELEDKKRKERGQEGHPKSMDDGGGMFMYERIYWVFRNTGKRITDTVSQWTGPQKEKPG